MARECDSCGVPLDGMDSVDGVCANCYKREEGKSISALTSRSNEMNIWHPAKNEAEAVAWFHTTAALLPDHGVAEMVKAGWTIPAATARGYMELKPGAPEHLRGLPMPPAPVNEWHLTRPTAPSNIAAEVVRQVLDRDAHGQRKYGVTLDRTDLSLSDWLQHMAEELMDGAHYALAAKRVRDQFEVEVRQLVTNAIARANDTNAVIAAHRGTWDSAMKAVMRAIDAELSK